MRSSYVEIIMPAYNGETFLSGQIDSIITQSFTDWKLIIRDDGSTDRTPEILRSYAHNYPDKIFLSKNDEGHTGHIHNILALMKESNAEYLMFCDQDDVWLPGKIDLTLNKMKQLEDQYGPDVPFLVFTDLKLVDKNLNIISESFWNHQKIDPDISQRWKRLIAQNVVTGCTMMLNLKAKSESMSMMKIMMDELISHVIDLDRCIAISVAKTGQLGYLSVPTVLYRQHDANLTGALQYGIRYLLNKTRDGIKIFTFFKKVSRHYKDVGVWELIYYKITINLKRLRM
jgi:glycosyltransferase involved in cell wall biosynthesis